MLFQNFRARLRGIRGLEWLAFLAVLSLLGLAWLNSGTLVASDARTDLEKRMEAVLSRIEGAGAVRVLVTERKGKTAFLSDDPEDAQIVGVLVVAEGAEDLRVRLALLQAVQALLPVEAEKIEIAAMQVN